MIPAGLERKKTIEILNYDDSSGDDEEYEGFVFDFKDKKTDKTPAISQIPEKTSPLLINNKSNSVTNFKSSFLSTSKNDIKYELNNNYFYDEKDYIQDDLKNAILYKNFDLVKCIFEKNDFDANMKLKSNWTPLMYAVSSGFYEVASYLIDLGADVNFSDGILIFSNRKKSKFNFQFIT